MFEEFKKIEEWLNNLSKRGPIWHFLIVEYPGAFFWLFVLIIFVIWLFL